jgi:peptidoglycan/xylan/chitin deacetylase (PgdA/CDA1 family)
LKRLIASCVLLLAASASASASASAATSSSTPATPAPFDVAVTVDDLSVHGPLPQGMRWTGIALSYIATLKQHRVRQAWGFVNAKRIAQQPASEAVLDEWRKAGYPLGNHTYSHLGLSQAPSLQAWIDDAVAGEPAIAARMPGADWRVLRFPFLDGGADQARHDGAAGWLAAHGYRIADVSLSFDDWAYTDTYARCLDKGDQAAIAALKAGYLRRVDAAIVRARALSQRVYGRMIPQVLLTHLGAWSAATLPEVMARLDAAGARYVTLEQAQGDAAYRTPSPHAGNGMLMERRARDAAIDLAGLPEVPAVPAVAPLNTLCR